MSAIFLWHEAYRQGGYGPGHPLAVPRVPLAYDLIRAHALLDASEAMEARGATDAELSAFHSAEYLRACAGAERGERVDAARFGLGGVENPCRPGFFAHAARAVGATLLAAELASAGAVAFNPAGGMHHARADRAAGFCYLNDVVLAILALRRQGQRVLYVDLDAHHGDAVEAAFARDPGTLTLSLHMDTTYAYPFRGGEFSDCGPPEAGQTVINVPLLRGVHDAEYLLLLDAIYPTALARFAPDVVVLQAGADTLAQDPLARLRLTIRGYLAAARRVLETAPRLMVVGGGGYDAAATARAWCGLWALLSGRPVPDAIFDEPRALAIRAEVREQAELLATHPFFTGARPGPSGGRCRPTG